MSRSTHGKTYSSRLGTHYASNNTPCWNSIPHTSVGFSLENIDLSEKDSILRPTNAVQSFV